MATTSTAIYEGVKAPSIPISVTVLIGIILFGLIFILSGPTHFMEQTIAYAALQGVLLASVAVPLSGLMALLGGTLMISQSGPGPFSRTRAVP